MSLNVVPPVNGNLALLKETVDFMRNENPRAKFLFMGDYVGKDGMSVIDYLADFENAEFLAGDKEVLLLHSVLMRRKEVILRFLEQGGGEFFNAIPEFHPEKIQLNSSREGMPGMEEFLYNFCDYLDNDKTFKFIKSLKLFHLEARQNLLFVHAPFSQQVLGAKSLGDYAQDFEKAVMQLIILYRADPTQTMLMDDFLVEEGPLCLSFQDVICRYRTKVSLVKAAIDHGIVCTDADIRRPLVAGNFYAQNFIYMALSAHVDAGMGGMMIDDAGNIQIIHTENSQVKTDTIKTSQGWSCERWCTRQDSNL